ncbi:MAG: LysM peptidoglycan-binding domain-containing protein [Opitutales bacterium]
MSQDDEPNVRTQAPRRSVTRSSLFSDSAPTDDSGGILSGAHPLVWLALLIALVACGLAVFLGSGPSDPETPLATQAEVDSLNQQIEALRADLGDRSQRLDQLVTLIQAIDQKSLPTLRTDIRNLQGAFQLTDKDLLKLKRAVEEMQAAVPAAPVDNFAGSDPPPAATPVAPVDAGRAAPPPPPPAPVATCSYTIRSGDTLWHVASRLGIPLRDLLDLNPELDPDRLQPGMVIKVPAN